MEDVEGSCLWREKTNVKGIEIGLNEIGIRVEYHSRKLSKNTFFLFFHILLFFFTFYGPDHKKKLGTKVGMK